MVGFGEIEKSAEIVYSLLRQPEHFRERKWPLLTRRPMITAAAALYCHASRVVKT